MIAEDNVLLSVLSKDEQLAAVKHDILKCRYNH